MTETTRETNQAQPLRLGDCMLEVDLYAPNSCVPSDAVGSGESPNPERTEDDP